MSGYQVTFLQQNHRDHWMKMWEEYMTFYQTSLPLEVVNHTFNRLISDDPNIGCIIACDAEKVPVGFLNYIIHLSTWTITPECYLQDLYVKPESRQAGIGRLLVNELKKVSAKQPCSKIYWITKHDNHVAQIFYNKIAKGEHWILFEMNS